MSSVASPPRAPGWEWAQVAILAANLAWTTLCLGGYRPETMVITTSLTGLLVAVHLIGFAWRQRVPHPAGWLFLPFVAYAAGNIAWVTPVRWLGWMDWAGWAQMIAIYWVVLNGVRAPGPRKALFGAMIGIAAVTVLMACYQRWVQPNWLMLDRVQASQYHGRSSGSFGIPNSLAAFLLLFLPALGAIGFRRGASPVERRWGRILTGMLAVGFVLTISRGGWIALVLALGAWPLLAVRGHWWRRVRFAVAAFGASLVAAGLLLAALPNARERFLDLARSAGERSRPIMWRASWELFRAEPVWGTGGGSYNVLFERHRPEQFNDEPQWAHNDYLNTLSDYGAVGFGLFFGPCAAVAIGSVMRRREDRESAAIDWIDEPLFTSGLLVGLLAFAVQLFVDFHFKIPALAMAFATVGALAVGRLWPARKVPSPRPAAAKMSLIGISLGALGVTAFGLLPLYRGEALRYRARQAIDHLAIARPGQNGEQEPAPWIVEELVQAVGWAPGNGQAWADLSYATSLLARAEPGRTTQLGREAEAAADRALAISQVNPDFWIRRGVARDMQGRWLEAGGDFTQATSIAPRNAVVWYYYADHLSRKSTELAMAQAALAFCLRLDPGNPTGIALRQRLAISTSAR